MIVFEAILTQGHKCVIVNETVCGFDSHSRKRNFQCFHFFALVPKQNAALSSATHHAIRDVLSLGPQIPLCLLFVGHNVKLQK